MARRVTRAFVDSNILVYALHDDPRRGVARTILNGRHETSAQALNEFVWSARRKLKLDWDDAIRASHDMRSLLRTIHPLFPEDDDAALTLNARYRAPGRRKHIPVGGYAGRGGDGED